MTQGCEICSPVYWNASLTHGPSLQTLTLVLILVTEARIDPHCLLINFHAANKYHGAADNEVAASYSASHAS